LCLPLKNCFGARCRENPVQNLRAFPKRTVKKQFTSRAQNVENEIRNRNVAHHFFADFLPAEALLKCAEGEGASLMLLTICCSR
jgi:hypothetical protein